MKLKMEKMSFPFHFHNLIKKSIEMQSGTSSTEFRFPTCVECLNNSFELKSAFRVSGKSVIGFQQNESVMEDID